MGVSKIQFENGIILLDKNIQYLLYLNGHQLTVEKTLDAILDINALFSLPSLGKEFTIKDKQYPPVKNQDSLMEGFLSKDCGSHLPFDKLLMFIPLEIVDFDVDNFEVLKM
mmetsp:Transcript_5565/g.5081  ORF Transcript_5565/g.5081 Transcript_5565/m.5081 type:complete len:111 (-) Transcript_5565:262-594(-)|eukprot:CAMPEP_0170549016 /NCGR_PEP_ID=MMETSP0211-20121228/7183_1 /TAXON_ID=311385 /ORGANISM="Pseudokeronopsis sp., Strain OXSARD2" /LENGTH=110 /DNA_ID=CAMNT_0010854783 /DNA_START=1132 /DNA_END=1464 /DNA_ORIENTATION=+